MSNNYNYMKKYNIFLLAVALFASSNLCFGQESTLNSKWSFGTTILGGYTYNSPDFANDFNNYGSCFWSVDLGYNRIHASLYAQKGWNSKNDMFDYGLRAGYSVIDRKSWGIGPFLGFGIMYFSHDSGFKNLPAPSVGANFDFKLYNNKKSKHNDIWMIRLQYNCSLPFKDSNIGYVHSIMLGVAVKGTFF